MCQQTTDRRSYAIIGAGGVGGFYGARLAQAGCDVHFLLRSDYQHVRDSGLAVESAEGDIHLPDANAYARPEDLPACDVTVIALKATQNHLLADLLPKAVADGGTVLLLQNGLGQEQRVANAVPGATILGGLAFICSTKVGPGHIRHVDYGRVTLGQWTSDGRAAGITPAVQTVAEDFDRAGIETILAEDLLEARWKKLVWNIPFNGLSVVLDATTREMIDCEATRLLVEGLMQEVAAAASADDKHVDDEFIDQMLADTARMAPYRTSMKVDYDAHRPMEVEAIYGAPCRVAVEGGVPVCRIESLYQQLTFLDSRRLG